MYTPKTLNSLCIYGAPVVRIVVRPYRVAELTGMEGEYLFVEEENTKVSVGSPILVAY